MKVTVITHSEDGSIINVLSEGTRYAALLLGIMEHRRQYLDEDDYLALVEEDGPALDVDGDYFIRAYVNDQPDPYVYCIKEVEVDNRWVTNP